MKAPKFHLPVWLAFGLALAPNTTPGVHADIVAPSSGRLLHANAVANVDGAASTRAVRLALTHANGIPLPTGSSVHRLPPSLRWHGLALDIQLFDTPLSEAAFADWLAAHSASSVDIARLGEAFRLVERATGARWLLSMASKGDRTSGVLSRQPVPGHGAVSPTRPDWLPVDLRLHLDLGGGDGSRRFRQQIYSHSTLAASALARQVFARLTRGGWLSQATPIPAFSNWQLGSAHLMLSVVPVANGSGLLAITTRASDAVLPPSSRVRHVDSAGGAAAGAMYKTREDQP